ncbi:MAG: hypothetical protein K6T85_06660 [Gorillibacterium sp.]|nr:hypothetical protein [Gorillibacterium sp.]
MTTFLDARTSQNASFANSIAIPILVINTPQLIGQIGLITLGAGTNVRVQLSGTASFQLPLLPIATTITITIVRGTLPTDPLIYSASESLNLAILGPQVLTAIASDFLPPVTPQLTYTMFAAADALGTIRVGPESLNGSVVSD